MKSKIKHHTDKTGLIPKKYVSEKVWDLFDNAGWIDPVEIDEWLNTEADHFSYIGFNKSLSTGVIVLINSKVQESILVIGERLLRAIHQYE